MSKLNAHQLAFIFGLLGNISSFMVFLAPLPTFYIIYKKKSSEGYQSIPYVIALLSAMLLLYYGYLKTNAILLLTINGFGCVIETAYLIFYMIYATKKDKMFTLRLLLLLNFGAFGVMMLVTIFALHGAKRVNAVGWICASFNLAVFASPLSIMKKVIKTRSVEYMPFSLSLCLTICATTWFFYGLFVKDRFIAAPNVVGFLLGIAQMILYMAYKNAEKVPHNEEEGDNMKCNSKEQQKLQGQQDSFIQLTIPSNSALLMNPNNANMTTLQQ